MVREVVVMHFTNMNADKCCNIIIGCQLLMKQFCRFFSAVTKVLVYMMAEAGKKSGFLSVPPCSKGKLI